MCNILKLHLRNLNLQKGVGVKPQKRPLLAHAAVEMKNIWLKSSILAVSKAVLRLFVN